MEYPYPEIHGNTISYEEIQVERVREMADAISRHPHMGLVQLVRQADGTEIIIAICDVQIKQHTVVPILETEEIAIICDKDNLNFPEIYALRNDFPLGLPHTNLKIHERPVSLCVTEFLYKEVKHLYNPYIFLESIRRWFSLTSAGKLHQEDQQLEPYFHTSGVIIIPPIGTLPKDQRYSVKLISSISGFPLYALQVTSNVNDPFICKVWQTESQVSGFIHRRPTRLSDIKNLLSNQGNNLIEDLAEYLVDLKRDLSGNKTGFYALIDPSYTLQIDPPKLTALISHLSYPRMP